MRNMVFTHVLKTFRRILSSNLEGCSDYAGLAAEIQARISELDVIVAAYEGETADVDYSKLVNAVTDLKNVLEGVAVPVFIDDAPDTQPVTIPPPPEAAYRVTSQNTDRGRVSELPGDPVSLVGEFKSLELEWALTVPTAN